MLSDLSPYWQTHGPSLECWQIISWVDQTGNLHRRAVVHIESLFQEGGWKTPRKAGREQEDDQVTLCLQRGRVNMDIWAHRFCCTCSQARGEANQPQTRGVSDVESSRAYVAACATVGCVGFVCSHARGCVRRHMDPAFLRSGDTKLIPAGLL